jgi:hypothetical protein
VGHGDDNPPHLASRLKKSGALPLFPPFLALMVSLSLTKKKVKVKVTLVQAMRLCTGRRPIRGVEI